MSLSADACIPAYRPLPEASPGTVFETGEVIARIFDLLEGTPLEPFAAQVAWRWINVGRHSQRC